MQRTFRLSIIAAAVILTIPAARAQLLDDVSVTTTDKNAVVTIRLNAQVQYLRHTLDRAGRLLQIEFQVLAAAGELRPSTVEEFRKLPPGELAPGITVEYPVQGTQLVKRMMVRFTKPVKVTVQPGNGNRGFRILLPLPAKAVVEPKAKAPTAPETGVAVSERYLLVLDTAPGETIDQSKPIPAGLQEYFVFTTRTELDGKPATQLNLGYFATEAEARKAQQIAARIFPQSKIVRLGEPAKPAPAAPAVPEKPGVAVTPPAREVPPEAPAAPAEAAPPILSPEELERHAADLLAKGRTALERNEFESAINTFNRLLVLPPNRQSQEAQELVGLARERNGELTKARAEYELYLKLYPEGEGAKRVRQRLAALGTEQEMAAAERARPPEEGRPGEFTASGSLSQYYYRGATRAETQVANATTVDKATFTGIDQSALLTNVDVMGRYRSSEWDNRLVFRDTYNHNFLDRDKSLNRVYAAYYDFRSLAHNFNGRLGRQTGTSGGVLGRFDGALVGYGLSPRWRVNAVAGSPVDLDLDSSRRFYGLSVDLSTFLDKWSGSAFVINQTVDGITDRRAVGGEVRYFDPQRSAYALVDYDVSFNALNIGMFQGTWTTDAGYTWNLLADYRRVPSLQTTNALISEPHTSMRRLLETMSEDQVRDQALARTAVAKQLFLGLTKPVSATWQLGADLRLSNIGALPETTDSFGNIVPAQPATGNVYNVNLQAIGTNLLTERDITVFSGGYITGPDYRGRTLGVNSLVVLQDKWAIEPSLRMYWQRDTLGGKLRRVAPGLRVSYRFKENMTFEFEGALEYAKSTTNTGGMTQSEDSVRKFFSVGYRYEF